jgi:hypothetical protein
LIHKAVIDIGNGDMKGAWVRDSQAFAVSFPSRVGIGDTNLGGLSLGSFERHSRAEKEPIPICTAEGAYLVGHGVERYATVLERLDPAKYTDSPEVRALTFALLAQMFDSGSADVALIVALPIDLMMAANVKETVKGIENWLVGEHRFTCDGREAPITVHAIKPMAQPVGAFFAWGLNEQGEWARDESDLTEASAAVLDSGFGTLDLLLVKQGRIEKRFTGGDTLGVRRAAEDIARAVKAQLGFNLSLHEADGYIRQYLDRGKVSIVSAGVRHDLKPIIRQALNSLATRTIAFVEETWGNANQFSYVLLAGGGALVLDAPIRRYTSRK